MVQLRISMRVAHVLQAAMAALLLPISALLASLASSAVPQYDPVNVWPMPTTLELCGGGLGEGPETACAGPHAVTVGATLNVTVTGCGGDDSALLEALAREAATLGTSFRASPRTYNEPPYEAADAWCPLRCSDDAGCGSKERCFVPSNQRWSSSAACSPSSKYAVGCGCCVPDGPSLPTITALRVVCASSGRESEGGKANAPAGEGYTVDVTTSAIVVQAQSSVGAAHGIATVSQLLRWDDDASTQVVDFVPMSVKDEPRFSWRGYMLDTSRHFIPVKEILQLIDGMYAAKLNVFHWHIVDAPSFPMGSAKHPELATEGSWTRSNATIYSPDDIASVMQRAKSRFVQVVLEIDTPAHTLAFAKSHPEMMTDCWEWMATARYKTDVDSDDCMALDPTNEAARELVADLLAEAASLEGASPYVHIGGDEVKFPCWNSSSAIAAHVAKTYGDLSDESFAKLQAEWTANVSCAAVVKAGKRPVLWQPTTKGPGDPAWDGALPRDAIYMIWLNSDSAKNYAVNGSDVVYTTPFYVAGMGGSGWTHVYNAPIMPDGLTPSQQAHVLGAEICMWGETMGAGNVFERGFQIGAAAAENFWRSVLPTPGPGSALGLGTSTRYNAFLCHLQRYGIQAPPVMPSDCQVAGRQRT